MSCYSFNGQDLMKQIKIPLFACTLYLSLYTLSPFIGIPDIMIIFMWVLSPFLVIWLVFHVLKDGKASDRTFEEYWYDDVDIRRSKSGTEDKF